MAGIDNNTVLYLRGDSFSDLSLNPKSITNNGVTISENGKFSKGLVLGSNQYLQIINGMQGVDLSKDFTIEWWEYSTLKSSNSAIFTNKINAGSFSVGFLLGFEGTKTFMGNSSVNWNGFDATVSKDKIDNIWIHWRFVKKGTQWMSYKNGIKFWTTETTVTPGKSDGDNCTIGAWLENSTIKSGYNAIISDFRISNIARCSENFTPPIQPFNSIDINITNQTDAQIDFNITKLGQETINKVEVLVNGIVSETYTDSYDNINYLIDTELCSIGNNKITIRVTFDDVYTEELSLTHNVTVDELPTSSNLIQVFDRQELLNNVLKSQRDNLKNILKSKNVEVTEEDKMSILIDKVDMLGNYTEPMLYLYKEGIFNTNICGDFTPSSIHPISITSYDTYFNVKGTFNWATFTNKFDLSLYSKLYIEWDFTNGGSTSNVQITLNNDMPVSSSPESGNLCRGIITSSTSKTISSIDITNVNSAYISIFIYSSTSTKSSSNIYNIWLEK